MITRYLQARLLEALRNMPVVALLGPRQVGKTTLALALADSLEKPMAYLDLESDADSNKLLDAEAYLKRLDGQLVIIDEVQRKPDLFRVLRGIVDARKRQGESFGHFLLLGSASKALLQFSSESLAGRIRYLELTPFHSLEIMQNRWQDYDMEQHWVRGGFPDSLLAQSERQSWEWRNDFIATYMERDLPMMGAEARPAQLKRFWMMLAHYHGNQVNLSEIGRSLELSHTTIKNYLDILVDFYMVRQIPAWSGNTKKRLVKAPKAYVRDSGILHNLLTISSMEMLLSHPKLGASWEGFVIENILTILDSRWRYSYYRTATQIEIDLVLELPNKEVWAIEIKRSSAPKLGRGFHEACQEIRATKKWIINASEEKYPLPNEVEVIGLKEFLQWLKHFQDSSL